MVQKIRSIRISLYWFFFRHLHYLISEYSYDGLNIKLNKNVFHPAFFLSTKNLYNFIKTFNVSGKTILELGAGTGLIALDCARRGANVTATDINAIAVELVQTNAQNNNLHLTVIYSDLFDDIPIQIFDFILINPPYYQGEPEGNLQQAFYAGPHFEYFKKLFFQLTEYIIKTSNVFMILADNCDIEEIKKIASHNNYMFILEASIKHKNEENYIFKIQSLDIEEK